MFFLISCHKPTEADKVKKIITEMQEAAEEKGIGKIAGRLSKTYRDTRGYDYEGIKGLLAYYFFRHRKVSVYIQDLDVSVTDASAKAVFHAVLSGGAGTESVKDLLPEALGAYSFDVSFIKESGEWKVVSAKWERVGDVPAPAP